MIKNYFKIALRGFWRHKVFTLINIIGLSIGISAALVIYLIVHFDFTFDNFHPDKDRIYRVVTNYTFSGEANYNSGVTGPLPDAVKNEVTGLETSAPFFTQGEANVTVTQNKKPEKFKHNTGVVFAGPEFFGIIQYKWLAGSAKSSLNGPYQLVLTSAQGKKYFPSLSYDQMLGKQVIYEDTIKTTVTGIVQEFTENTDITFHDFISFETMKVNNDLKQQLTEWGGTTSNSQFFIKLLPKTTVKNIEGQLNALLKKHNPPKAENKGSTQDFHLQPLGDLHFNSKYGTFDTSPANKTTLYGLMVIALFLLLLGCINFINLTTAQAGQRSKEIGIRKTMGSTRGQLIFQYLSETFIITLFAVLIAVALTPLILKLFADFIPKGLTANFFHQPDLILFLFVLTVVVSLLSGFYPALVLSGYKPILVLKNQAYAGTSKTRNVWLRKSLTVTQFVIAQFFIMATVLVSKQIYFALHTDLGFKKDAIIYVYTPWKDRSQGHKQILLDKIRSLPQVALVSVGGDIPSSNGWNSQEITYKDGKKEIKTDLQTKTGDENYIKVYGIKLLAGRNITMADTASGMLINSNYAHILGFKDVKQAIGKMIDFGKKKQIVGVIADFHQASLHAAIKPLAIYPSAKFNNGTIHIALRPQTANDGGDWKKAIAAIGETWKQVYPDDDFDYHFFDETVAKFYNTEQHTSTLLTWATGLSIFISCLGLLGLAIYTTNQRTKEIGVRKVLGASVAQIVTLLSTELIWLILLAFVVVTPIAWYAMNKWMESFVDRTAISWWIFAISGAAMLLAAVFTSSFQTIRAAIANPVKSLRSE
ncbi:FtsX-like permease family protein [Mucilaginibacter sp.]|uniref:FtsX-like permease family protein n=1 Tax=Mucilaginibacter sp. TaxID=1882438 RepID=UPI003D0CF1DC